MAKATKTLGAQWLGALQDTELAVESARDALAVSGWLDTGNYALNWAISGQLQRGYPLGHTGELFGDPGTGKSFLVTRALGMAQAQGGVAMVDDTEGAYNLEYIGHLGVDPAALAYRHSRTVKEHLGTAKAFISAYRALKVQTPGVLACDSLALLSTEHELEVGLDKRDMTKAAELKAFFRIVGPELINLPVAYLATNHTIANIGGYGNQRTTPGGGGPKFQASYRLDLRATSKIKRGADYTGVICRVVVVKNRVTAPFKEVRLAIPFYRPLSRASGLVALLLQLGILRTKGHYLTLDGEATGLHAYKSKEKFLDQDQSGEALLEKYPDLLDRVDEVLTVRQQAGQAPWDGDGLADLATEDEEDAPAEVEEA